jgi:uncharacterized secreted protein with C-terminal beta-propeller domain
MRKGHKIYQIVAKHYYVVTIKYTDLFYLIQAHAPQNKPKVVFFGKQTYITSGNPVQTLFER